MDNIPLYITKTANKLNCFYTSIKENRIYIEELTKPIYQLSDTIITQLCYPNSLKTRLNYIQLLSTFFKYSPKNMKPQLEKSTKLAEFLVTFILKCGATGEGEDAFKLFLNSFNIQTYQPYLTEEFIKLLFEALTRYDDSELIRKQIYIMIDINSIYPSLQSNTFMKIYHEHPDFRQIQELLMEMLNKEKDRDAIYKIIICLRDMIDKENKCILYSNDLQVIIDIILNSLQSTYADIIKLSFIELLQRITAFNDYFKEMYRIDEVTELLEDYTTNKDHSTQIKTLSQSVLQNILNHLQSKFDQIQGY